MKLWKHIKLSAFAAAIYSITVSMCAANDFTLQIDTINKKAVLAGDVSFLDAIDTGATNINNGNAEYLYSTQWQFNDILGGGLGGLFGQSVGEADGSYDNISYDNFESFVIDDGSSTVDRFDSSIYSDVFVSGGKVDSATILVKLNFFNPDPFADQLVRFEFDLSEWNNVTLAAMEYISQNQGIDSFGSSPFGGPDLRVFSAVPEPKFYSIMCGAVFLIFVVVRRCSKNCYNKL